MKEGQFTERTTELDRNGRAAYRVTGDTDDTSTRIIRGIDDIVGEDTDRQTWLYDKVDPDALDAIFKQKHDGTSRTEGKVVFNARGCEIVVQADGDIIIYAPADDSSE
ncbi:hypothetical protein A4G99_23875 [Haladaptatus sp. R4]|uniref:HalOD1 output domain-containing protein n=1 Tax=Haladaptatus sp. R4 TaxID=1679489 RepID=UPI0007B48DE2|nr:HalOD1 output domain-containing protein [Haladaptatus sp. R4]KZN25972.1 hypothetical protein A4G99_23875 [Haladaptatus sp. R4]